MLTCHHIIMAYLISLSPIAPKFLSLGKNYLTISLSEELKLFREIAPAERIFGLKKENKD